MFAEKPVYLDNAATTKADVSALESIVKYGGELYYNPSAGYVKSLEIKKDIEEATDTIAGLLGASREEIIFTSCATESNNEAFECGIRNKKGNVVLSAVEHASVYESAMRLKSRGMDVRFVKPLSDGRISSEALQCVMDENTAFVSIIHCSNETGTVNDIQSLCAVAKERSPRCVFHSDGVQAFCKIPTDVKKLGVDLYSISAHKVGGLKGVGALYVKKGLNMPPFIVGGGQQNGRRSGTENVGGIIGFAKAALAYKDSAAAFDASKLRQYMAARLTDDRVKINGSEYNSGYILSLSFEGLRGEVIAHMAEEKGVLVGLGSACSTHVKSNRVLEAMRVPRRYAEGSIRISFSPHTTTEEVEYATEVIAEAVEKLRKVING